MTKLSVVLPGIRTHLWQQFYDSVVQSVGDYSFEIVFVGPGPFPESLNQHKNIKYLRDFGHPCRCGQIGTMLAEGEIFTWSSDDAIYQPNALRDCINLLEKSNHKDGIVVRYCEGQNWTGSMPADNYWIARTHDSNKLPGVLDSYMIAPVGMYYLDYFTELGGWDCRFEHLNMSCHDLAFRVQNDGGQLHLSPNLVMSCDWCPNSSDYAPMHAAYRENDLPLFQQMYSTPQPNKVKIDFNNWKDSPSIWPRRFK